MRGGPFPLFKMFYFAAFYFIHNCEFRVFFEKGIYDVAHIVRGDQDRFCFPVIFVQPAFVEIIIENPFHTIIVPQTRFDIVEIDQHANTM